MACRNALEDMVVACRVQVPQVDDPPGNDQGIAQGGRGSNARARKYPMPEHGGPIGLLCLRRPRS